MSKPLSQSTTFQSLVTRVTALENAPEGAFIFEASGTGSDQSTDLNSLISSTAASGKYCIISGTFFAGSPIVIPSGAKILGIGKATIIAHPNLPLNSPLVVPSSYSSGTDNYSQSDVRIIGVTFDGANRAGTDFLIKLYSVDGLTFEDCRFRNYQYGLLALGGCRNISLNSLSFSNWGKPDVSIEGGPALWIAGNLVSGDNTPSRGVRAFDLDFRNSEWVAIYLFARDFSFIGGTIDNVKEGGFYGQGLNHAGSSSPADSVSSNGEITGYRISNIIRKYIASSGIEIGGSGLSIHHNTIFNCEDAGIKLNWPVAGALVESNDVYDTVKAAGSYNTYATYGQITVIQIDGSLVQDVTIRGNRIGRRGITPIAPYAVKLHTLGPNGSNHMDMIDIDHNDLQFGYVTSPVGILQTAIADNDAHSRIRGNIGHASERTFAKQVQLPATTGLFSVTVGFPASYIRATLINQSASIADMAVGVFTRGAVVLGAANQGTLLNHKSAANQRGQAVGGAILRFQDDNGTDVWAGQITTISATGFTINVFTSTISPGPWAIFECES